MATRLILVRHGQTECNLRDIWHGWDECGLTDTGLLQAEAVGERLRDEPISAIYSSPSLRALQTAGAIARRHGLEPMLEPRLRERNAGEFEGQSVEGVLALRPNLWEERNADFWGWTPPGGETFRDVLARSLATVERARLEHPDDTVVFATHMGPVRVLLSHFLDIPLAQTYEMSFPSTGVSILCFEDNGVYAEVVNDAGHVGVD